VEELKKLNLHPEWLTAFDRIVEGSTAGLPQDINVKRTHLSITQIISRLGDSGLKISRYHIKQMLRLRGYRKRKLVRKNELSQVEQRNERFEKIMHYRNEFTAMDFPVLSIDTKKKEMTGNFHRPGQCYSQAMRRVNDPDFASFSDGQVIPHGIYDVNDNTGYITLGTSKDTSEFVCDNLLRVRTEHLQYRYPQAHTIMILCDGGGSNACSHYIVKQDLCKLSKRLNINILMVHYPPCCSKYSPIEHRLFAQLTRAWQGVPFYNIRFVKELAEDTTTSTGLVVNSYVNTKEYQIKRKVDEQFKTDFNNQIVFDDKIPKWNYLIKSA
jgi:hypothetical protein